MTAESLLDDLRHSQTDLAHLVEKVRDTQRRLVIVSADAVDAWRARDPQSWRKVNDWLCDEGVAVRVV